MNPPDVLDRDESAEAMAVRSEPVWAIRGLVLWRYRRMLLRVAGIALLLSLGIAFIIPKEYKSVASIMPPEQRNTSAMMLAALSSRASGLGALGSLASNLLGGQSSTALFMDLLRSGTVSDHLIDRFHLQDVYHKRYRVDAAKHLAHCTKISDDKKSGVITIVVEDTSRERARDLAQAYLDELNALVNRTSTSSARRERMFIERRLDTVQASLEQAELDLSRFSSQNSAVDIREQTRAMVEAGARVQAQLIVERSSLQSLRQIYGEGNVRVREAEARIGTLQGQLAKMTGAAVPTASERDEGKAGDPPEGGGSAELYPPLKQLPRLAVPYTDLYRRVRVQETVFELLTQQYEMARIEEARDVPAINVIDAPGIPEKKSFPPRLLLSLLLTALAVAGSATMVLVREGWEMVGEDDPRRVLAHQVIPAVRARMHWLSGIGRGTR